MHSIATDDDFSYNLTDLITSDFMVSEDDNDFELSLEQVIVVMKM